MLLCTQLIMFPPCSSVLAAAMAASVLLGVLADQPSPSNAYINYTTITGYFLQDEASTNSTAFDFMTTNVRVLLSLIPPFDQVEGMRLGDVGSLKHPILAREWSISHAHSGNIEVDSTHIKLLQSTEYLYHTFIEYGKDMVEV